MPVTDTVRLTIRQHRLAGPDTRVLVALSGGSDSVALAHLLHELAGAGELRVAGAAHLNHQLRAGANDDEAFCARLAASLGWQLVSERADVAAVARQIHRSIEDAARTVRHDFLERARLELGADAIALGHTRDDQAETFLLRLIRGAGPRGLSGMHPRNGRLIRPLLDCRRDGLRAFLAERNIPFVHDESNDDVSIPRNRVRAELLPLLETRFNPRIVDTLAAEAEQARDEWAWMESSAAELGATAEAPGVWRLDLTALARAPRALRRLVVWKAMTEASGGKPIAFEHVERALETAETGGGIDAPGHRLERIGSTLVLRSRPAGQARRPAADTANLFHYPLSIPGEVALPEAGWVVTAEVGQVGQDGRDRPDRRDRRDGQDGSAISNDGRLAIVRSDVRGPLAVRNRRPGDTFRPIGLGGRKKLQDFFVDRKVGRDRRDFVPLVVDETDRIVWVAGYGIDEEFRVTDPAQAVLILRLKQLGGRA